MKSGKRVGIYISKEMLVRLDEIRALLPGHPSRSGLVEEGINQIISKYSEYPDVKEKMRQFPIQRLRVVKRSLNRKKVVGGEDRNPRVESQPTADRLDKPTGG